MNAFDRALKESTKQEVSFNLNCPGCNYADSNIVDSRKEENSVRRKRKCRDCSRKWITYEIPQKEFNRLRRY